MLIAIKEKKYLPFKLIQMMKGDFSSGMNLKNKFFIENQKLKKILKEYTCE